VVKSAFSAKGQEFFADALGDLPHWGKNLPCTGKIPNPI
jgi:hypothetical protein